MVKNKSIKKLDNSQVALTLTIGKEEIEKAYKDTLKKYLAKMEVPGFRKGHVPESIAERKFGDAIREEATFNYMEKELTDTIATLSEEDKPLPYSTPVLQDEEKLLPFKKDEDITYTCIYDVYPQFKLPAYTGLEFEIPKIEVEKEDIDKEIEKLQEQNSLMVDSSEGAKAGDYVSIEYTVDGGEKETDFLRIGEDDVQNNNNIYQLDEDIVGMKKGDTKEITKSYAEDDEKVPFKLRGKTVKISLTVESVKRKDLPEVDDEFAQDVSDKYKTVKDLRDGIKARLLTECDEKLKGEKAQKIIDKILSETKIDVPESMMQQHLENSFSGLARQYGISQDQFENLLKMQGMDKDKIFSEWKEGAEKDLKGQIVLTAIQKDAKLDATDKEVEEKYKDQLENIKDENVKKSYMEIYKDEIAYSKVIPYLLEKNTFKEGKKISLKEFNEPKENSQEA